MNCHPTFSSALAFQTRLRTQRTPQTSPFGIDDCAQKTSRSPTPFSLRLLGPALGGVHCLGSGFGLREKSKFSDSRISWESPESSIFSRVPEATEAATDATAATAA